MALLCISWTAVGQNSVAENDGSLRSAPVPGAEAYGRCGCWRIERRVVERPFVAGRAGEWRLARNRSAAPETGAARGDSEGAPQFVLKPPPVDTDNNGI